MAVPSDWPQKISAAGGFYAPITQFNDEPFVSDITFDGVDYTGAAFVGSIRAAFEIDSAELEAFTFGTPSLVGSDTVVSVSITEADVEALRDGTEPGAIETLYYSIKITPSGGAKRTFFAGEFYLMGA